jgi:hypothetical protein
MYVIITGQKVKQFEVKLMSLRDSDSQFNNAAFFVCVNNNCLLSNYARSCRMSGPHILMCFL